MKTRSEQTGKEVFWLKAQWQQKPIKVKWLTDETWLATLTLIPERTSTTTSWTANGPVTSKAENAGRGHLAKLTPFAK